MLDLNTNKKRDASQGFTLIELLVVIAIIGILSSVVLASLSGARESAQVTKTIQDFRQIETAVHLWMNSEGFTEYPTAGSSEVCGGTGYETHYGQNCPFSEIITNSNSSFSNHLSSLPEPAALDSPSGYSYYYERYQSPDCGDDSNQYFSAAVCGVNIGFDLNTDYDGGVINKLDNEVDGGDGSESGKLRWDETNTLEGEQTSYVIYHLSDDHSY